MLKVQQTGEDEFWVYEPTGGRGRHCRLWPNGIVKDTEKGMFAEPSPESYQKAVKRHLLKA